MTSGYFHRVHELSPTRLWINNPTLEEAQEAIEAGAISCTTNPTYASKMLKAPSMREAALQAVDAAVAQTDDDQEAADLIQQQLVRKILDVFLPLYEKHPGQAGFVSIQGNPFLDHDPERIADEAVRYSALGRNFIAKIPATKAGIAAMEQLIPLDIPMIATEIMGIAQLVDVCEMYRRVSAQCGKIPPIFLTHITGIFDEHLRNVAEAQKIDIVPDLLWQAGCIVARKQYRVFKERNYPGIMLGGGARGLHHFTEMVGGEMQITINWKGTADRLIEEDPPVVYRMDTPAPQFVVDELTEKFPDFRKAYSEDGLAVDEFEDFGPVVLFRNSFVKGWEALLQAIADRRV